MFFRLLRAAVGWRTQMGSTLKCVVSDHPSIDQPSSKHHPTGYRLLSASLLLMNEMGYNAIEFGVLGKFIQSRGAILGAFLMRRLMRRGGVSK